MAILGGSNGGGEAIDPGLGGARGAGEAPPVDVLAGRGGLAEAAAAAAGLAGAGGLDVVVAPFL